MKTICITCKADCHNAGTMARIIECSSYKPGRILTNADRIRVMSDEDMAIWLAEWSFCADACPASTNEVEETICFPSNCKEQALTWLQQPAEEET